jgi:hypothetical protein
MAKTFTSICKSADWDKLAKARITVKNLAEKKESLKYLAMFLDALSESAVEAHGMRLSDVYPSARIAPLISKQKLN